MPCVQDKKINIGIAFGKQKPPLPVKIVKTFELNCANKTTNVGNYSRPIISAPFLMQRLL